MSALIKHRRVSAAVLAALLFIASGCVSVQRQPVSDPWALFSEQHRIYVQLPAAANKPLAVRILRQMMPSVSEAEQEYILERLGTVYMGISPEPETEAAAFELAVQGDFPRAAVSAAFSEKYGWQRRRFGVQGNTYEYFVRSDAAFEAAPLASDMICLASSMEPMIERYAASQPDMTAAGIRQKLTGGVPDEQSIRFYCDGASMLPFAGGMFQIPAVSSVSGSLTPAADEEGNRFFVFSGSIAAADKRIVNGISVILRFAAAGMGGSVSAVEDVILIEGLRLDEEMVYSIIERNLPLSFLSGERN